MKLTLIKWLIGYLWRNHKYLLIEQVVPDGFHLHRNPTKPNPAVSGTDE